MGLERFCCDLSLTAKKAIFVTHCGYGVIGSRARLRIWCRKAWGFESLYPHKSVMAAEDKSSRCVVIGIGCDRLGWKIFSHRFSMSRPGGVRLKEAVPF